MAQIFEFRGEMSSHRPSHTTAQPRDCEIIIFPGVRYERWDDVTTAARDEELANIEAADARDGTDPTPKRRKRKSTTKARDILVLPD